MAQTVEPANAERRGIPLRHAVRHWLVYGLGSVASRLAGLLLLPLYTRYLTPEDYGIKAMVVAGVDVVGIFLSLGVHVAMMRFYTEHEDEAGGGHVIISTGLILLASVFTAGVGLACWGAGGLAAAVFGDAAFAPFLRLGLVTLLFANVFDACMAYLQLRRRSGTYSLIALGLVAFGVSLNLCFVVALGMGVRGMLLSELLTAAVFCAALLTATLREVGRRFSPATARRMLRYGAPLLFTPLAWTIINQTDRFFLTRYATLADVGVYSLAIQFGQVLAITVVQPFAKFWEPAQFDVLRHPDGPRLYTDLFRLFGTIVVVAAFGFAVAVDDVVRIMTAPPFWPAAGLVPIVLVAQVLIGLSLFFNSVLLVRNWTGWVGGIAALTALANVAANALLVPYAGSTGAALSRVIAAACLAGATYVVSRRTWPVGMGVPAVAGAAAAAVVLLVLAHLMPDVPLAASVLVKLTLVLALLAVVVTRDDRARLRAVLRPEARA